METRSTPEAAADAASEFDADDATAVQIRGSSLLLVGRVVSLAFNLVIQILIVRALSKAHYGAFAYALSLVSLGETIVTLGLDRAVTRFVPIYDERREPGKVLGTLVLVLGSMLALGLASIIAVHGFRGLVGSSLAGDGLAVSLLSIMIFLSPIQAFDHVVMGMFAVFSNPRAIFFRKYVLEPALRLAVVLILVFGDQPVRVLAVGYVLAGAAGVVVYGAVLYRMLRARGLFERVTRRAISIPFREVYAFTIPLLTSDLVYTVMNSTDAILLGRYRGAAEVGAFRVVQPAARLNQLVMTSFALLFTPMAARLFARRDQEGINRMYWQSAIWMAVLSFPIFAVTFSLARPVTTTLFGERYASSAVFLSLLAVGYYFNASVGHNGLTLKVFGKLRYIVVINVAACMANVGANLYLIPRHGALGAAIGTSGTLVVFNILKQVGLRMVSGVSLFQWNAARIYLAIAAASAALLGIQAAFSPPLVVGVMLAGVASLAVLFTSRSSLRAEAVFPELSRIPIVRSIVLGGRGRP